MIGFIIPGLIGYWGLGLKYCKIVSNTLCTTIFSSTENLQFMETNWIEVWVFDVLLGWKLPRVDGVGGVSIRSFRGMASFIDI